MGNKITRLGATPLIAAAAAAMVAGCSPTTTSEGPAAPTARPANVGTHGGVILTPLGAARVGLQTAAATGAGKQAIVPTGALLYEADGQTVVYSQHSPLVFTIRFVTVTAINGNQVIISSGLAPGTVVVTQGAEELLGVQNGIGVET